LASGFSSFFSSFFAGASAFAAGAAAATGAAAAFLITSSMLTSFRLETNDLSLASSGVTPACSSTCFNLASSISLPAA
jgi:hypothetical protein